MLSRRVIVVLIALLFAGCRASTLERLAGPMDCRNEEGVPISCDMW